MSASPRLDQEEEPNGFTGKEVQTDESMGIRELYPDTVKNSVVVTGSIGKGHGQSDHCDMAHVDNARYSERNIQKADWTEKFPFMRDRHMKDFLRILVISGTLGFVLSFQGTFLFVAALVSSYSFCYARPQRYNSTRLIKWKLDKFSEGIKEYVFTSPAVQDKSGSWVLAIRQTADEIISFGLIAKSLGEDVNNVVANIQIFIRIGELELIPESEALKFVHKFECDGDCGFSPRIPINYEQLMGHTLEIGCRICFTRQELAQCSKDLRAMGDVGRRQNKFIGCIMKSIKNFVLQSAKVSENGLILPVNKMETKMSTVPCTGVIQMVVSELDEKPSITTCRLRHTVKPEVNKPGSIEKSKIDGNNLITVTGSTGGLRNGQSGSEYYDLLSFENVRDFDCIEEKCRAAEGIKLKGHFRICLTSVFLITLFWCIFIILGTEFVVLIGKLVTLMIFIRSTCPTSISTTRVIKWTLDEFSEEVRGYFFTSPPIHDKSGTWRLVLRQVSEEEANFGLIATDIAEDIHHVVAKIEISARISGRNSVPGLNDVFKFVQTFQREGHSGYSTPIYLSFDQLKNHKLEIKCRIRFTRNDSKPMKRWNDNGVMPLYIYEGKKRKKYLNCNSAKITEYGIILSETKFQSKIPAILTGMELEGDSLSFMKHTESKVFVWKIPNFSKHLKNVELWEIFSPKLLVSSFGFCSIWRLQLVELEGVFRIYMELRGLPRRISKIKMRYLLELMDNCGEFIAPNNCVSTIKYPEHVHLNGTSGCFTLYRRETILERFLDKEDSLNLRISLQCEPRNNLRATQCEF